MHILDIAMAESCLKEHMVEALWSCLKIQTDGDSFGSIHWLIQIRDAYIHLQYEEGYNPLDCCFICLVNNVKPSEEYDDLLEKIH